MQRQEYAARGSLWHSLTEGPARVMAGTGRHLSNNRKPLRKEGRVRAGGTRRFLSLLLATPSTCPDHSLGVRILICIQIKAYHPHSLVSLF